MNSPSRILKYNVVRAAVYTYVRGYIVCNIVDTVFLLLLLCFVLLFIQKHPSIITVFLSLTHSRVYV